MKKGSGRTWHQAWAAEAVAFPQHRALAEAGVEVERLPGADPALEAGVAVGHRPGVDLALAGEGVGAAAVGQLLGVDRA